MLEGKIGSGGSVKYWATVVHAGTVLVVRDVPVSAIEAAQAEADDELTIEILEPEAVNLEALIAEREQLLARLAQLDEMIESGEKS